MGDFTPVGEESDDFFGRCLGLGVGVDSGVAVAFGESSPVGASDQGQVGVGWLRFDLQSAIKQQLACCRVEQVVSSDDLGDPGIVVIDDDGELIAWGAAFRPDHEVASGGVEIEGLGPHMGVFKGNGAGLDA